jgi:hypothetical protein
MKKTIPLLTGLFIMAGTTFTQADWSDPVLPLVFGNTYVSSGANAEVGGDIVANTYLVVGAGSAVNGNIQTGTAITFGAGSTVGTAGTDIKNTLSGTATTLGASTVVSGSATYGTAFTLGAGAIVHYGEAPGAAPVMPYESGQVNVAQNHYNLFTATDPNNRNVLATTMPSDVTLDPSSFGTTTDGTTVVYNAASLTTGAGITLTLTGGYDYIFNIADMLSLGAGTIIVMTDCSDFGSVCGSGSGSVTWNMGGYASVGAHAEMIGAVFAGGYISTGVDSEISGANAPSTLGMYEASYSGGLFSATSYVTIGAGGKVNGYTASDSDFDIDSETDSETETESIENW